MEFLKDLAASLRRARTVELPDGNQLYCQHYLLLISYSITHLAIDIVFGDCTFSFCIYFL